MSDLYDEFDSQGGLVRSGFSLGMREDLPAGHTWVAHVPQLYDIKEKAKLRLEEMRDISCMADIVVPVGGVDYIWQADKRSQDLVGNAVSLVSNGVIPCPEVWRTKDNQNIPVGLQDLKNMAGMIAYQTSVAYAHSWALKDQVDSCITAEEVAAVVW